MTLADSSSEPEERSEPGRQLLSRDELLKIVRATEDEIRRDTLETLIVFDQTGREVFRKPGQHDNIRITAAEHRRMRGQIVTHNHPRGWAFPPADPRHAGHSFSLQDVSLAISGAVSEMRVVTPVWRFSMRPGEAQRWSRRFLTQVVLPAYHEIDGDVRRDFMSAVQTGRITLIQAIAQHHHEV